MARTSPSKQTLISIALQAAALTTALALLSPATASTAGVLLVDAQRLQISEGVSAPLSSESLDIRPIAASRSIETAPKLSPRHLHPHGHDVYLSAVRTQVFADRDRDGYFSGFNLALDVDTDAHSADVYATISLARANDAFEPLLTSNIFHVDGHDSHDTYHIEIELRQQFPADLYDLRVDIHDAYSNQILDQVTPTEFRNLGGLPLEAEAPRAGPPHPPHHPPHDGNFVSAEYAGGTGVGLILALAGLISVRRRLRK